MRFAFLIFLLSSIFSGCNEGTNNDEAKSSSIPTTEEDGVVTAMVGFDFGSVTIAASSSSAVKGGVLDIPVGALEINTEIVLQEGGSLGAFLGDLNIDATETAELGPAFAVTSTQPTNITGQLNITIPFNDNASLSLQDDTVIAVIYLFEADQGELGLATGSEIAIGEKTVSFAAKSFGSFQVIRVPQGTTATTTKSTEKVVGKRQPEGTFSGFWRQPCVNEVEVFEGETEVSSQRSYLVTGPAKYRKVFEFYGGGNCEGDVGMLFNVSATSTLGDLVEGSSDIRKAEFLFETFTITPKSTLFVNFLNQTKRCGKTGWELDVPKDLTGGKCEGGFVPGETQFTVVRFQKDVNIFLGQSKKDGPDATSDATRWTTLDAIPHYRIATPSFE